MSLRSLALSVLVGIGITLGANAQVPGPPETISFNLVSYSQCNPTSCIQMDYIPLIAERASYVSASIYGVCQTWNSVNVAADAWYAGNCPYDVYLDAEANATWSLIETQTPFGNFAQGIGYVVAFGSAYGDGALLVYTVAEDTCDGHYDNGQPQYSGCFPIY